ncbi:MAG: hypothetical protein AAGA08_12010 [Pseudomonadota bacterium]
MSLTKDDLALAHDQMVEHLTYICDALERAEIPYFLSSGTLLGAVREGDILQTEERDIDLDINHTEVERVLALNEVVNADGYAIIDRVPGYADYDIGYNFRDMSEPREPVGGAGLLIEYNGVFVGDIFINAIYSDGFARRQCLHTDASVAAKMTVPAWYYEGNELAPIRGRNYPVPRLPRDYLRKTYGEDWETPIPPGGFGDGRHPDSGTVYDSDMERLTLLALEQGWDGDYSGYPAWPREIKRVASFVGRRWIMKHETYFQIENRDIFTDEETRSLKSLLASHLTPFRARTLNAMIASKCYIAWEDAAKARDAALGKAHDLEQSVLQAQHDLVYLKGMKHQLMLEREAHAKTQAKLSRVLDHPAIKLARRAKSVLRKLIKKLK